MQRIFHACIKMWAIQTIANTTSIWLRQIFQACINAAYPDRFICSCRLWHCNGRFTHPADYSSYFPDRHSAACGDTRACANLTVRADSYANHSYAAAINPNSDHCASSELTADCTASRDATAQCSTCKGDTNACFTRICSQCPTAYAAI